MTSRTVRVPDGLGGWTELEGDLLPGAAANTKKQDEVRQKQFIDDAAAITERILQFDRLLVMEKGLAKEHRAFAAALYCVNLRETYPGADGKTADPAGFDAIAKMAADYYDASTSPKR